MVRRALALLFLLLLANAAICQTFQYSHGWTNGKRSEFPIADMTGSADERFVNGDSRRLRMLLHGNADEQVSAPLATARDSTFIQFHSRIEKEREQSHPATPVCSRCCSTATLRAASRGSSFTRTITPSATRRSRTTTVTEDERIDRPDETRSAYTSPPAPLVA